MDERSEGRTGETAKTASTPDRAASQRSSAPSPGGSMRMIIVAAIALAAGTGAGWFGHEAHAKARLRGDAAGGDGSCSSWQQQICSGSGGDEAAACQQAKTATELLTPATCDAALEAVPETLARVKAGRAVCDNLVTKLCADLSKESASCKMVEQRTPSLPSEACKEMLEKYDQVLGQFKMLEAQQQQMMGGPHGAPPGAVPHAHPHGSDPHPHP
jgi:hypothetical protein